MWPKGKERPIENLAGQRFGKLLVLSYASKTKKGRKASWLCLCDCGNRKIVQASNLKSGHTQSCGCYRHEQVGEASEKFFYKGCSRTLKA